MEWCTEFWCNTSLRSCTTLGMALRHRCIELYDCPRWDMTRFHLYVIQIILKISDWWMNMERIDDAVGCPTLVRHVEVVTWILTGVADRPASPGQRTFSLCLAKPEPIRRSYNQQLLHPSPAPRHLLKQSSLLAVFLISISRFVRYFLLPIIPNGCLESRSRFRAHHCGRWERWTGTIPEVQGRASFHKKVSNNWLWWRLP